MNEYAVRKEWRKCQRSPAYFIHTYCHIYDAESRDWIAFKLWREQYHTLQIVHDNQQTIILKARQLGLTWLMLGYALWQMLYEPIATVLIFSKRDDEAVYLLSDERLRGVYKRLPEWMKAERVITSNDHTWELSNGSTARAFPTSAGDSYTATFALVDEADLVPDLGRLMSSVKPTIDNGGKLVLLSRVDKSKPNSLFKNIYRAAKEGANSYKRAFLPWHVHPKRDGAWYANQQQDSLKNTGSLDALFEQYPGSDEEALRPATLDKRIPPEWVARCYQEAALIPREEWPDGSPNLVPAKVWKLPEPGRRYVAGMDCAEGLPSGDDSVSVFFDADTGEQVAMIEGKIEPDIHAYYTNELARWYNHAALMVENVNHGWRAIGWLQDNGTANLLRGHDGKDGWSSNTKGKLLMYDLLAEVCRDGELTLHDYATMTQIQSIEKGTLRAPEGEGSHDDKADAVALAVQAMRQPAGVLFG
jgi:hypothetical protein